MYFTVKDFYKLWLKFNTTEIRDSREVLNKITLLYSSCIFTASANTFRIFLNTPFYNCTICIYSYKIVLFYRLTRLLFTPQLLFHTIFRIG